METKIEKIGQISCSICQYRLDGAENFIADCGEWICNACRERKTNQVDKSSKTCELTKTKVHNQLIKRRKIERPLRPAEAMLKLDIDALKAGLQGLASFDYTDLVNLHWKHMENNVKAMVENSIRDMNVARAEILATIKKSQERSVKSSPERVALDKVKVQEMSSEVSAFVSAWSDRLGRSCPEENDQEIEGALAVSDIYKFTLNSIAGNMNIAALEEIRISLSREILSQQEKPTTSAQITGPVRKLSCNGLKVFQVSFMPDGMLLSYSSDVKVTVWNVSSGKALDKMRVRSGYSSAQTSIVALPGGMIAACSYKIYILDLKSRTIMRTLSNGEQSRKVMLVLKSGLLASFSSSGTLNIWNPFNGQLVVTRKCYIVMLSRLKPFIGSLSNGDFVISLRETHNQIFEYQVRDSLKGNLLTQISTSEKNVSACLVLSNDLIALGKTDGAIKLIDTMNGSVLPLGIEKAHDGCVINLIETQTGKLVSCAKDSAGLINIKVWILHDLSLIHTCIGEEDFGARISISVSPDEKFVAAVGVNMNYINIWQLE